MTFPALGTDDLADDDNLTLDPPGTIAVVGAGTLGIETALYGRFLGYDVALIEASEVGHNLRDRLNEPLDLLPDQCLSTLAIAAIVAQQSAADTDEENANWVLPTTFGEWIQKGLIPLTETDLLRGRVRTDTRVMQIAFVNVEEPEEQGEDTSDIPPDFALSLHEHRDQGNHSSSLNAEAVILAVGESCDINFRFDLPVPYLFRIGSADSSAPKPDLIAGRRQIVQVYSQLAGRSDLNLYRPRRL